MCSGTLPTWGSIGCGNSPLADDAVGHDHVGPLTQLPALRIMNRRVSEVKNPTEQRRVHWDTNLRGLGNDRTLVNLFLKGWNSAEPGVYEHRWCSNTILLPLMEHLCINREDWKGWMMTFYNSKNHKRVYWLWIQNEKLMIFTIGDEDFRFKRKEESQQYMQTLFNYLKMNFEDRKVFEQLFRKFNCKWGFETIWKIRQAKTECEVWTSILPRLTMMNRSLLMYEKMRIIPTLTQRAIELSENAKGKRLKLVCTAMKKMAFYHIRYQDPKCRYPGVFYNKQLKPSLLEEVYQQTMVFGFPRHTSQDEELAVLNEMIWDDCLSSYIALIQTPVYKKRVLELLGFGKRLPNGWMMIYDVPRHFRIVLFALQVESRHHTEFYLTFTSLSPGMEEFGIKAVEIMREFLESAFLANRIAMDLIDEAYVSILEEHNNDVTVVTMEWFPNREKYDYELYGKNSMELSGRATTDKRIIPSSSSRFHHPPKTDKDKFYREKMEIFEKHEFRRHAIFAANFQEMTRQYRDCDTPMVQEMRRLTGEKCLYIMKGFQMGTYKDWNTKTIAKSMALWQRPAMETMPFPFGTEICTDTDSILAIIWNDHQKFCIEDFTKYVEIMKAEHIPEDKVLMSFSPTATEAFTRQFVVIIFQEEYYQLRYECVNYYWSNMDELLSRNPKATWMVSLKEQVRQPEAPNHFIQMIQKIGERWRDEWERMLLEKQARNDALEERRIC
jgi:hypothetical protein